MKNSITCGYLLTLESSIWIHNFLPKNWVFPTIQIMEDLPYDEFFAKICGIPQHSNSLVVWEGEEQGLNIFFPNLKPQLSFSYCFGPLIS